MDLAGVLYEQREDLVVFELRPKSTLLEQRPQGAGSASRILYEKGKFDD